MQRAYTSPLHDRRNAGWLGIALGVTFASCFVTGIVSHLAQETPSWLGGFEWPSRPAGLYRVTQGIHVLSGIVSVPLLLAKLWVVYPHFTAWPPVRSPTHAVERVTLLPLVGGGLFLLVSGTANVARWYPWTFFFPRAHFWVAWVTIGALVIHIGAKAALTRDALRRRPHLADTAVATSAERRAFLGGVAATAATMFLATAGGTVRALGALSALAPRRPGTGPQGVPVNKSASGAGIAGLLDERTYRLVVDGAVAEPLSLSLDRLRALPQHEAELPIACVEGWSTSARWRGVRVRDLLAAAGARPRADVVVSSAQARGLYRRSELSPGQAADPDTLLALELNGEALHPDHGWPMRLIGPNRPGVLQTKWVTRLTVR